MLSKLRPRSIYDVMAAIACFVALGTGTAYAANTIRTGDIVDNEVFTTDVRNDTLGFGGLTHPDLGPGSVRASEISNGTLNDEDISERVVVNFTVNVGVVPAHSCVEHPVTGLTGASGDHLVLTPNFQDSSPNLDYSAQHSVLGVSDAIVVQVCNPTTANINDGTTLFNLLVIDAQ